MANRPLRSNLARTARWIQNHSKNLFFSITPVAAPGSKWQWIGKLNAMGMREPADRIAADSDASRLAVTARSELPHRFVCERAAARDHADPSRLVNVTRHDADFASAGRDDTGTIGADQARPLP